MRNHPLSVHFSYPLENELARQSSPPTCRHLRKSPTIIDGWRESRVSGELAATRNAQPDTHYAWHVSRLVHFSGASSRRHRVRINLKRTEPSGQAQNARAVCTPCGVSGILIPYIISLSPAKDIRNSSIPHVHTRTAYRLCTDTFCVRGVCVHLWLDWVVRMWCCIACTCIQYAMQVRVFRFWATHKYDDYFNLTLTDIPNIRSRIVKHCIIANIFDYDKNMLRS